MPQYAKPLTLHKGVDNQIQFKFLNQEQKPVDITGKEITCRIINSTGKEILLNKALEAQLPKTGLAVLTVNAAEIEGIDPQKCSYSLEIPVGDFDFPVFVDQNAGARGTMNIVNSVLPSFVPSYPVSIPTSQVFPNVSNIANANSAPITYFSSIINTKDNPILTIQTTYSDYYGNVKIQGSTIVDGDWYTIDSFTYANTANVANVITPVTTTGTVGYTVTGYHPYVRVEYSSNCGNVTNILTR